MTDEAGRIEAWPLTALLRAARTAYGSAIRADLDEAGYDDVPRKGINVISGIAHAEASLSDIIDQLGVSKQAAGALVDTPVTRGYVERTIHPEDRRRLRVSLTERGDGAAAVVTRPSNGPTPRSSLGSGQSTWRIPGPRWQR